MPSQKVPKLALRVTRSISARTCASMPGYLALFSLNITALCSRHVRIRTQFLLITFQEPGAKQANLISHTSGQTIQVHIHYYSIMRVSTAVCLSHVALNTFDRA